MKRILGTMAFLVLATGCSPYLYGTEISRFSTRVDALGTAYRSGMSSTAAERHERQRWQWAQSRAKLALTPGCVPSAPGHPQVEAACELKEVGKPAPTPSVTETEAAKAAPILKALSEYAASLAAVTNAADRQALEAAQAQLRDSIQGLVTEVDPNAPPLGAIGDVVGAIGMAALDTRRFWALRDGVNEANAPIKSLGGALGEALDSLRTARSNELRSTADVLVAELGPGFATSDYVTRSALVDARVTSIDALRRSDPRTAAREMVEAHDLLARALRDSRRQVQAVATAMKAFVDKAKAVREAFES